jgi:hypothetical protein
MVMVTPALVWLSNAAVQDGEPVEPLAVNRPLMEIDE